MGTDLSKSKERRYGIILSYLEIALSIITAILYTPLMLRLMGKNEYGLYGTINSTIALLGILDLGFTSSYIKFYSKYKKEQRFDKIKSFNSLFFIVFFSIGLIAFTIGMFLTFHLDLVFDQGLTNAEYAKAKKMMLLLTISMALGFITTVFSCYISANEKFIFIKLFGLCTTVITVLLNLCVLYLGYGALGLVYISFFIKIISQLIYIFYCYRKLNFGFDFKNIDKSIFKQVLSFSLLVAINLIVDKINQGIDSVLLGRFCGTAVVAVYSVGASLNSHFTSFSTAISGVFTPHVHDLVNKYEMDSLEQRKTLTSFFVKVGRLQYLLMALIASGVVFFGKPFIRFWAGDGYEESYYIALILILPSIVPLIQNVGIEIQRAENRHHYRSYIYGAMAIINFIISVILCQIWGGIGSAIGTGLATIVANGLIMNIVYHKKINIDMIEFWKNIGQQTVGMIIPFICGALIMHFVVIDSIIKMVLFMLLYTCVYAVCIWFFSMNRYEKDLVLSFIHKMIKK